jgi:hypothetical protein
MVKKALIPLILVEIAAFVGGLISLPASFALPIAVSAKTSIRPNPPRPKPPGCTSQTCPR